MSEQPNNVGDRNVEKLLAQAYQPAQPDAALLPSIAEKMCAEARHNTPNTPWTHALRENMAWGMSLAAMLAGVLLTWYALRLPSRQGPTQQADNSSTRISRTINPDDLASAGLKPKARPAAAPVKPATAGETVSAQDKGRRVLLADGSVLYLNRETSVRIDADRRLTLTRGEVFVEVAPKAQQGGQPFVITAGQREVKALGTKFAVRTNEQGRTGVVVTQGKVQVTGYDRPISAGQQVHEVGTDEPAGAQRASFVLDWTRELMAESDSPLVPESKYSGGALVAVDPDGQEARLTMRNYHVDVHVEDGFARTVIDQTYFNHANFRMEGTFYFPLPPDASLSRLAMYVDGNLMEGGMAERNHARNVFEEIMYSQRDPALLEWVDGSTFKMRVFPLEARQEKRIIIAYTQRLPALYGQMQYRFPSGHSLGVVSNWGLNIRVKDGQKFVVSSDSHELKQKADGNDLILSASRKETLLDRDVTLNVIDPAGAPAPGKNAARFSSAEHEGNRYVMLRYRPELKVVKQRQNRNWVILFESSGDRDPLLARAQVEIVRTLLGNAEHNDTFVLLTANTRVHSFRPEPQLATPENITNAIQFLESSHLIGALDLSSAFTAAETYLETAQAPCLVHVGSGIAALGERRADVLVKRLPQKAQYVGVGVGKRWARDLMKTAAERSGGYFTQINPDEPIAWRAFDLAATLNTPRLMDVKVLPEAGASQFLLHGNSIAQGEEICALAQFPKGQVIPKSVTVLGTVDGEQFTDVIDIPAQSPAAGHLPRTWAKLELDRLLAEDAQKHKEHIIELSKQMYVMTPFTSLLVLENDEMYERFKVDRGRKDHWAPYQTPQKIEVKFEPEVGQPIDARFAPKTQKPHRNQIMQTVLVRIAAPTLTWPNRNNRHGDNGVTTAANLYTGAFAMPTGGTNGGPGNLSGFFDGGNLENDEIGNDADLPVNYNIERLEKTIMDGERGNDARKRSDKPLSLQMMNGRTLAKAAADERWAEGQRGRSGATRTRMLREGGGVSAEYERLKELRQAQTSLTGLAAAAPAERSLGLKDLARNEGGEFFFAMNDRLAEGESGKFKKQISDATPAQRLSRRALAETDRQVYRIIASDNNGPRMYGRPSFSHNDRVFADLLAYAPGMNTSAADIEGVLEAEAAPTLANMIGAIDPAAVPLVDAARQTPWQTLSIVNKDGKVTLAITFDGQGRYAYERTLPNGLHEEVVCDGKSIVSLYPDLGVGSRRPVTRFHRTELAQLVPSLLPPIEDLARGFDVKRFADKIVALVPRGADQKKDEDGKPLPYAATHLVFGGDGRLVERRIVDNVLENGNWTVKPLFTETYGTNGAIRLTNAEGKELSKRELKLSAAQQPNLTPDVTKLVVLPLPLRSRDEVYRVLDINPSAVFNGNEEWTLEYLTPEQAMLLLATEFAQEDRRNFRTVQRRCFINQGENKLGFYTLMTAMRQPMASDLEFQKLLAEQPESTLGRYLALEGNPLYRTLQARYGLFLGEGIGPRDHFLTRLATFRDLDTRLSHITGTNASQAERTAVFNRGLAFVERNQTSVLGWAMLSVLQDRAQYDHMRQAVAQAWKLFIDDGELGYVAQYEHARNLYHGNQRAEAAVHFRKLYEKMLTFGMLPPIDGTFRQALLGDGKGADVWTDLMQRTAHGLLRENHRQAVVNLAWQCWQLGDAPLAENLLADALRGRSVAAWWEAGRQQAENELYDQQLAVTVQAVGYLMGTGQDARADSLLTPVLENQRYAKRPGLWRLLSQVAARRSQVARSITCLENALEIEFQQLPDVINLQQVRNDYSRLLNHYEMLAGAVVAMKIAPPSDLAPRTVRATDRWRALDRENAQVCDKAAAILKTLGARDLAWDYVTTPIGMKPNESAPLHHLAWRLNQEGDFDLANLAYQAAYDAEPTDAQILWNQAQNLKRAGRSDDASKVLQKISDGNWQPRFSWLKSQARWQLEGR